MEDKALDTIANIGDDGLLVLYEEQQRIVKLSQNILGHIEQEIYKRCRERGATGIPSDLYDCEIKESYEYSPALLAPLKEQLSPAELETCYEPEHPETVTVPERWSVTKLKPILRKHGKDALDKLEEAKVPKSRKLVCTRKES